MPRDLDFDVDASRAAAADGDDDDAGGPGGSFDLLLDLVARFDSNLDAIGAEYIFGVWASAGTEAGLLFNASALLSLFLIGSMPAGGGGGGGGGLFALPVVSPFLSMGCTDLPRCNLLICS